MATRTDMPAISFQPDPYMYERIEDMAQRRESRSEALRELVRDGLERQDAAVVVTDPDGWRGIKRTAYRLGALITLYIAFDAATPYMTTDMTLASGVVLLAFAGLIMVMAVADAISGWIQSRRE
jgi:hypothetical protein